VQTSHAKRHFGGIRLSLLIARLTSRIIWVLPSQARLSLARVGGWLFYRFSQTYRENVQANLRQVFGSDRATREVFRTSARNFVDLLRSPWLSHETLTHSVAISDEGHQILRAALAEGKGVLIVSAHLGAIDFIGQCLHHLGYEMTVVTARTTSRFIFDGVTYLRGQQGLDMVEPTPAGLKRTLDALRHGRCVALLADRDFLQNGKPVVFFGRATTLPVGALRLARETGAPIVPLFTRRVGSGHQLLVRSPIRVARTADPDADIAAGLHQLVPVVEDAIRRTPSQWVMFQPVWPKLPVDPVRAFPVGSPFAAERERSLVGRLRARFARLARHVHR
jgi:KDO2-lipid IV(A) lauroyltransferase